MRSFIKQGYRYAISKKAIQKLICPPLLYNGLGKSRNSLSQGQKEIKWLEKNTALNYKLKVFSRSFYIFNNSCFRYQQVYQL